MRRTAAPSRRGLRGPTEPAGSPRARALPRTGPADARRRAEACGAAPSARFPAAVGAGFWEYPREGTSARSWRAVAGEARSSGVEVALGRDRALFAGDPAAVRAFGGRLPAEPPDVGELGRWLREVCLYPSPARRPADVLCGPHRLAFGHKTYVVAILNRTRDSFSQGRRAALPAVAAVVAAAWQAWRSGADIVDIGAESSEERDHGGLSPRAEARRLLPVLEALGDLPAVVSIDCRRGSVAAEAARLRPVVLNDVDALADPDMARVAAAEGLPVVLMHTGDGAGGGRDLMEGIAADLSAASDRGAAHGVAREQMIWDAGFGFGKSVGMDLESTRRLGELRRYGHAVLHAPSRKRSLGRVLAFPDRIAERLPATAAAVAAGILAGADMVRVHDLPHMARVARTADALAGRKGWQDVTAV